jgi:hypothetical protein
LKALKVDARDGANRIKHVVRHQDLAQRPPAALSLSGAARGDHRVGAISVAGNGDPHRANLRDLRPARRW